MRSSWCMKEREIWRGWCIRGGYWWFYCDYWLCLWLYAFSFEGIGRRGKFEPGKRKVENGKESGTTLMRKRKSIHRKKGERGKECGCWDWRLIDVGRRRANGVGVGVGIGINMVSLSWPSQNSPPFCLVGTSHSPVFSWTRGFLIWECESQPHVQWNSRCKRNRWRRHVGLSKRLATNANP